MKADLDESAEMERMAEEVLELAQLAAVVRSRFASGTEGLTEPEYLALDALVKEEPLTVGEVQKRIGVLPAQMSRILRSLEKHSTSKQPLVECRINPDDRRRVDVNLTEAGKVAHRDYKRGRLDFTYQFLAHIQPDDRQVFMRIIRDFHQNLLKTIVASK